MSIQYIFGGSGTGKTSYCLKEMANRPTNYEKPLIYIVPEQFTLESEKNLCEYSKSNAIITSQVLSFQRLAYHLFSKEGGPKGRLLDDIGKNVLLRKVVFNVYENLSFYKKVSDKAGFIDNLSQIVMEFYQYNMDTFQLENYMEKIKENESLYLKMKDLYLIYKFYSEYINDKYILTESILDFAPKKIEESKFLTGSEIWIDGFTGFTPQEYKIIEKLMKNAENINIALTLKSDKSRYNNLSEIDPFYEIKLTVNKISDIALENKITINEPKILKEAFRFNKFPEMKFLEENYLSKYINVYDKDISNISIFSATNRYIEVSEMANQILKLVRDDGYLYKDIAVVAGDVNQYEKILGNVFDNYDIPVFIDTKMDILSHPLTELIRSAVDILAYNWTCEGVFRFLKTGLATLNRDEIDVLENYVLAYGIKSYKWKLESWNFGQNRNFYNLEEINIYKNKVLECLEPFISNFTSTKKYSIEEFSTKIFDMLVALNINEKLEIWSEEMALKDEHLIAKQHIQIYTKIAGIFEKMVEILGDEKITAKEFVEILDSGFKSADLGVIPPSQDQVVFGDISRSRLPKIKALFIIGANEGVLPSIKNEKGLFSDEDRVNLTSIGAELAPNSKQRSFKDQFDMYSIITKPENKLFVSFSKGSLDGKAMQPSSLILRLRRLLPNIIENEESTDLDITLPKPMFKEMGQILRAYKTGKEISPIEKDLYNWFATNPEYIHKLKAMEKILFTRDNKEFLSEKSAKRLYQSEIFSDISRLEKYMECPFAYYVQYNLYARERKIYEVKNTDLGTFFHNVLEDFSKSLDDKNINWNDLDKEKTDTYVEESVNRLSKNLENDVLLSSSKYKYMVKRVSRILKKSIWALSEHIKDGKFEPYASEVGFGKGSPLTSISININKTQKFILKGRIDRVDIMDYEGNRYIKIIDYKSGTKKFGLTDLYFGTQLQLMIYLDAFIKNSIEIFGKENIKTEVLPGGIFYFNIDDPILEWEESMATSELSEMVLKTFKMSGLVLNDMDVIKGMDENIKSWSKVIPVQLTNAGISKKSSVASIEEFELLRKHVLNKTKEIGNRMVKGEISVFPYKKTDDINGCTYCNFKSICQIETLDVVKKYNMVKKVNDIDEVL